MGCGASSATQIAPMSDADLMAKTAIDSPTVHPVNGLPPDAKLSFKSRLFQNKSLISSSAQKHTISVVRLSVAVQTEDDLYGIKSQFSQTDIQLTAEEEMDLIMSETSVLIEAKVEQERLSPGPDSDTEVDKSVLLQTEESMLSRKEQKKSPQVGAHVTIDVGIQVKRQTQNCATQTRFGTVNTSKTKIVPKVLNKSNSLQTNLRKSMSVDTDNYRLWTAPNAHQSSPIDTLNIISVNNSHILTDIDSQTDPKLSCVLSGSNASSDLTAVLHSYDMSSPLSPLSHIERELLNKNHFLKVPDNRLQDCLSKLLDDMDDTFRAKANTGQSSVSLVTFYQNYKISNIFEE